MTSCPLCDAGIPAKTVSFYNVIVLPPRKSKGWRRHIRRMKAIARRNNPQVNQVIRITQHLKPMTIHRAAFIAPINLRRDQ